MSDKKHGSHIPNIKTFYKDENKNGLGNFKYWWILFIILLILFYFIKCPIYGLKHFKEHLSL